MKYGDRVANRHVAHILTTDNPGETQSDFEKVYNEINHLKIKHTVFIKKLLNLEIFLK